MYVNDNRFGANDNLFSRIEQPMVYIRKSIHLIACIKRRKIAAKIACVNGPLKVRLHTAINRADFVSW